MNQYSVEQEKRIDRLLNKVESLCDFVREQLDELARIQMQLLTKDEVADIFGVSVKTVDRMREERILEWVSILGSVRFHKSAIWKCIVDNSIKTAPRTLDEFNETFRKLVTDKRKTTWRK